MTVTLMKLEDMSLQHWLKEAILPLKWVEQINGVSLTYSAARERFEAEIVWLPNFLDEGRGWVYFENVSSSDRPVELPCTTRWVLPSILPTTL